MFHNIFPAEKKSGKIPEEPLNIQNILGNPFQTQTVTEKVINDTIITLVVFTILIFFLPFRL